MTSQFEELPPLDYRETGGLAISSKIKVLLDHNRIRRNSMNNIITEGALHLVIDGPPDRVDVFGAVKTYLHEAMVVPDSYRTQVTVQGTGVTGHVQYTVVDTTCYSSTPTVASSL